MNLNCQKMLSMICSKRYLLHPKIWKMRCRCGQRLENFCVFSKDSFCNNIICNLQLKSLFRVGCPYRPGTVIIYYFFARLKKTPQMIWGPKSTETLACKVTVKPNVKPVQIRILQLSQRLLSMTTC